MICSLVGASIGERSRAVLGLSGISGLQGLRPAPSVVAGRLLNDLVNNSRSFEVPLNDKSLSGFPSPFSSGGVSGVSGWERNYKDFDVGNF